MSLISCPKTSLYPDGPCILISRWLQRGFHDSQTRQCGKVVSARWAQHVKHTNHTLACYERTLWIPWSVFLEIMFLQIIQIFHHFATSGIIVPSFQGGYKGLAWGLWDASKPGWAGLLCSALLGGEFSSRGNRLGRGVGRLAWLCRIWGEKRHRVLGRRT